MTLATLEELLTGESADRLVEENADAQISDPQQGAMVFRVREQLADALAQQARNGGGRVYCWMAA